MEGLRNKLGLTVGYTPTAHKKYLGEPEDPHFIPESPLIDRQTITEQEEGELRRMCALALSEVPHSDDMTDDPFKYMASQIMPGAAAAPAPASAPPPAKPAAISLPKSNIMKQTPPASAHKVPDPAESATPSESSKRDTFNQTDYSTPLTSAGITPGETGKRFSDALRRPNSSKESSNLKYGSSQASKSRATSSPRGVARKSNDAGVQKAHDRKPSKEKQTIKLVRESLRHSEAHSHSAEITRPVRFSQLELNKKLPPLPRSETEPVDKASIGRLMKTIKNKRSQVVDGRSFSASAASSLAPPMVSKFSSAAQRHSSRPPPAAPTEQKQQKFKFSKFFGGRKDSLNQVLVS